uniref:Major facilitator superfamily (MFS) profile domain-containing protein n=1 Tax=Anopheles coluzzii TaxID=1518534 RepID=A0A8W7Q3X1_ANOCL
MDVKHTLDESSFLVHSFTKSNKSACSLNRKKSLSVPIIPSQNENFLCVPKAIHSGMRQKLPEMGVELPFDDIAIHTEFKHTTAYQTITKSVSQSTLPIPENYSFTSVQIQIYKRRWFLLVLTILNIAVSYVQWIQYSIVANIMAKYYNISSAWIDWTSMIFMVIYIIAVFPVSYVMDVRNMRQSAVIGTVGTALGAWIKVFSTDPSQFQIVIIGQIISAVAQVFLLSIPSRLSATWFSPEEASSVCAFGVFGAQLGIALALESRSKKLLAVASVFLGFFMTGFQPIGYEFAAELTFPEPDGPVMGILNISTQIFGIVITLMISGIQKILGDLVGNIVFAAFLLLDGNIIALIRSDLRRYNTHLEIESEAAREFAEDASVRYGDISIYEDSPLKLKIDGCS